MCEFFSFCTNGRGKYLYLDWPARQQFLKGDLDIDSPDSHTSILDYHKIDIKNHDKWNKYEYNFLTGEFTIDAINNRDDSKQADAWVKKLDTKQIVPALIVKKIINPLEDIRRHKPRKEEIKKLKMAAAVGDSVWDFVWDSVRAAVRDSVWDFVGDSVRDSVRDSVGDSVWDSVGDSVWAYISSFFRIEKYKNIDHEPGVNPLQPYIDLWEKGLVPSFDGKVWRLHGYKGKIVWQDA